MRIGINWHPSPYPTLKLISALVAAHAGRGKYKLNIKVTPEKLVLFYGVSNVQALKFKS
jgi:hypothetical protein